jgi:hypothetical protein
MKRFIFKFWGGPLDGTSVAGELAKSPEVRRYYALTHHGRVGQRFRTASEYAVNVLTEEQLQETAPHNFQQHLYEVVERIDNGDVTLIRVEYVHPPAT